MHLLIGDGGG